jgi:amino acid permease
VSQHNANRANYAFNAVKTIALEDCSASLILDIYCSMKQPHYTQIGWLVLKRNLHLIVTLIADKGYDLSEFRLSTRRRCEAGNEASGI